MTTIATIALSAVRAATSRDPARADPRWPVADVEACFELPFMDLLFRAQQVHREHFDANEVQLSTLLSIKTGGCPEDCAYCPQSAHFDTGVEASKLMPLQEVIDAAQAAKAQGATRFCMGAAWRSPKARDLERVAEMVREVKALGLETCMTLGMLDAEQAQTLDDTGLDYYNHNLDSAPEFYRQIIGTRTYQDRLDTLANLDPYPESVPINNLVQVEGTPLAGTEALDPFEFVRTIAVARITMPKAMVRLSAGREQMDDALQAPVNRKGRPAERPTGAGPGIESVARPHARLPRVRTAAPSRPS